MDRLWFFLAQPLFFPKLSFHFVITTEKKIGDTHSIAPMKMRHFIPEMAFIKLYV